MTPVKRTRNQDTGAEPASKKVRRGDFMAPKATKTTKAVLSSKKAGKTKDKSTRPSRSCSRSLIQANSPAQDSSLEEEIYCFCGTSFDDGNTVFCESCRSWQHIACYYPDFVIPQVHTCVNCSRKDYNDDDNNNDNDGDNNDDDDDNDDNDDDDDDGDVSIGPSRPQKKTRPLVPARKFAKSKPRKKTPGVSAAVVGPSSKGKGKRVSPLGQSVADDTFKTRWFSVNVDLEELLGEPQTEREERLHEVVRELVQGQHNLAEQIASMVSEMLRLKKRFELMLGTLLEDDEV